MLKLFMKILRWEKTVSWTRIRLSETESRHISFIFELDCLKNCSGSGGIRTHASEETDALNQRIRPLCHATFLLFSD